MGASQVPSSCYVSSSEIQAFTNKKPPSAKYKAKFDISCWQGCPLKPPNKAAAEGSHQKQQSQSVAVHADAPCLLSNAACSLQDGLCPESAAQQAAEFSFGNIHSVLAVGTSGPVFYARCNHLHHLQ